MRTKKIDRQERVLEGLIELYIESGKPIGSNTLKEHGFGQVSSATIRNDFASLEANGYLEQTHASGGRAPTSAAFRWYAEQHFENGAAADVLGPLKQETKEVSSYLHQACELLSEAVGYPVFLSAPRFDHDMVLEIRLLPLDHTRTIAVMLTDFGSVLTEVMATDAKLSPEEAARMEEYFAWRLTGLDKPKEVSRRAQKFYHELMVRYITRYSSFSESDLVRTGFSRLLDYPEFADAAALASGLSLFENATKMRALLGECLKEGDLTYWIDEAIAPHCAVVALPYRVNGVPVGALGVLGPTRIPYPEIFGALRRGAERISETLGKSLGKFRISYRQPETGRLYLERNERRLLENE